MKIAEIKEGQKVTGVYICSEKQVRSARTGNTFIHLILQDVSGRISGKIWKNVEKMDPKFVAGEIVQVSAFAEKYLDEIQLRIVQIDSIPQKELKTYQVGINDLLPSTEIDPQKLFNEIMTIINEINDGGLRALLYRIFKNHKSKLTTHPGSKTLHHSFRSGLIEHIYSMALIGKDVCRIYDLDRDLLLSGILLHDIGKLDELEGDLFFDYGDKGHLIGHIVLGRDLVNAEAQKIRGLKKSVLLKLEHMILSHHGNYEWQSPKKPCFPEALMLHLLDHMDSQMNIMHNSILNDKNSGNWTSINNYYRMALYKGSNETE